MNELIEYEIDASFIPAYWEENAIQQQIMNFFTVLAAHTATHNCRFNQSINFLSYSIPLTRCLQVGVD